jgi:tetratricopeptide (TPR) repeat protein
MKNIQIIKVMPIIFLLFIQSSCNFERIDTSNTLQVKDSTERIDKVDIIVSDKERTKIVDINENDHSIIEVESKDFHHLAREINDKAMNKITGSMPPYTKTDTLLLIESIKSFDQAIDYDSAYQLAYANKSMVLSFLGNYIEAIHTLDYICRLNPDYAEGFVSQGFFYEKTNFIDSANAKYKEALLAYSNRINLTNKLVDKINKAFIVSLINKDEGIKEIDYLIENNPNDSYLKFQKQQLFIEFDREKFMHNR